MKLDTRARQATRGIRQAVGSIEGAPPVERLDAMRRRRRYYGQLAAAVALVLAALAIGGIVRSLARPDGEVPAGLPAPVSKETFVAQANAICAAANEQEAGTGVIAIKGEGWEEFVAVGEAALADLRALPRPEGDEEEIGEMLRRFDSAYATLSQPDILEAWRIAGQYGLDECTGLGYVPPSVK